MPQIRKHQNRLCVNAAVRQTKMYQQEVIRQVTGCHTRTTGVQVAKIRVGAGGEFNSADKGQTLTVTHIRTGRFFTQQLVVVLRTLELAVTHVVWTQTYTGPSTAVETGTRVALARCLILTVGTIIHAIAAEIDGQAVSLGALKVGHRTFI